MTYPSFSDEPDNHLRADWGRMALHVFAELTHRGGVNVVADAEGIAIVVPELICDLLHLLDVEGVPIGLVINHAFSAYAAECVEDDRDVPDPIELLRAIYKVLTEEDPDITESGRLDEIVARLRNRGWTDDGSPFEM